MNNQRCVIVGAAPCRDAELLRRYIHPDDVILCADGGYLIARSLGLSPALVLGDFDSGSCPPDRITRAYPRKKDDTDMLLAVKEAIARGFEEIVILGGLGGRLDHTMANFQTLAYAAQKGVRISLCSEDNEMLLLCGPDHVRVPRRAGFSLSVFAFSGDAEGVTLEGVAYPLSGGTLTPTFPLGVSNEWTAPLAEISVEKGMLAVICSRI